MKRQSPAIRRKPTSEPTSKRGTVSRIWSYPSERAISSARSSGIVRSRRYVGGVTCPSVAALFDFAIETSQNFLGLRADRPSFRENSRNKTGVDRDFALRLRNFLRDGSCDGRDARDLSARKLHDKRRETRDRKRLSRRIDAALKTMSGIGFFLMLRRRRTHRTGSNSAHSRKHTLRFVSNFGVSAAHHASQTDRALCRPRSRVRCPRA